MKKLYIALVVSMITLTQAQAGPSLGGRTPLLDYMWRNHADFTDKLLNDWLPYHFVSAIYCSLPKGCVCRDPFSDTVVIMKERDIDRVKRTGYGRNFDLRGADFKKVDLAGADLRGARLDDATFTKLT